MNITDSLPLTLIEEQFQTLAQKRNVKIERILGSIHETEYKPR